jgi:hydroxypyruvate reductase
MRGETAVMRLRDDARAVFLAGVAAADPRRAVIESIEAGSGGGIIIAGEEFRAPSSLRIVAVGKASRGMALAALEVIPEALIEKSDCAIVVNRENAAPLEPFTVFAAGHPLPDEEGVRAARFVEDILLEAGRDEAILLLLSGGGSALLPAPAEGIDLVDKRAVTELLLGGGADIHEINTVRKHLSRLKGGGMARAAQPAALEALILSDVFDDDLSSIASGPTVPDPTRFADAIGVLRAYGIWERAPDAVRRRLEAGSSGTIPETPKAGDAAFDRVKNTIIGSNLLSLEAARRHAESLGYAAEVLGGPLTGEAREAAERFAGRLRRLAEGPRSSRGALLAGGETTVTLRGKGKGGRNQEMALAVARAAAECAGCDWVFLSGGTDGRDGPTDAAGGLVDAGTVARGREAGEDPERALRQNDSYGFLQASGDLLMTGATGTNVADLQVLLWGA